MALSAIAKLHARDHTSFDDFLSPDDFLSQGPGYSRRKDMGHVTWLLQEYPLENPKSLLENRMHKKLDSFDLHLFE